MPTNPAQVRLDRRHFATIGVTVPTKPARSIRILADDNIGRMSDAQQPPGLLTGPAFTSPLLVTVAAYLAVHPDGKVPTSRGRLLDELIDREDRHWQATALASRPAPLARSVEERQRRGSPSLRAISSRRKTSTRALLS